MNDEVDSKVLNWICVILSILIIALIVIIYFAVSKEVEPEPQISIDEFLYSIDYNESYSSTYANYLDEDYFIEISRYYISDYNTTVNTIMEQASSTASDYNIFLGKDESPYEVKIYSHYEEHNKQKTILTYVVERLETDKYFYVLDVSSEALNLDQDNFNKLSESLSSYVRDKVNKS